jgi:hypothetical protein
VAEDERASCVVLWSELRAAASAVLVYYKTCPLHIGHCSEAGSEAQGARRKRVQ